METNNNAKTSDWIQRFGSIYAHDLPAVTVTLETVAERYERLRNEIVASGVQLLTDDELRAEIQARRGDRD